MMKNDVSLKFSVSHYITTFLSAMLSLWVTTPSFLQGMPDWQQIVKELPPMEALLSKLER